MSVKELNYDPFEEKGNWSCFYEEKRPSSNIKSYEPKNTNTDIIYTFGFDGNKIEYIFPRKYDNTILKWMTEFVSFIDIDKQIIESSKNFSETVRGGQDHTNDQDKTHFKYLHVFKCFIYNMIYKHRQIYLTLNGKCNITKPTTKNNNNMVLLLPIIWVDYNNKREFITPYNNAYSMSCKIYGNNNKKNYQDISVNASTLLTILVNSKCFIITIQMGIYETKEYINVGTRNRMIKTPQYCDVKIFYLGDKKEMREHINWWISISNNIRDIKYYDKGDIRIISRQ